MWITDAAAMMGPDSALCHVTRQTAKSESERDDVQAPPLDFVIQWSNDPIADRVTSRLCWCSTERQRSDMVMFFRWSHTRRMKTGPATTRSRHYGNVAKIQHPFNHIPMDADSLIPALKEPTDPFRSIGTVPLADRRRHVESPTQLHPDFLATR